MLSVTSIIFNILLPVSLIFILPNILLLLGLHHHILFHNIGIGHNKGADSSENISDIICIKYPNAINNPNNLNSFIELINNIKNNATNNNLDIIC